MNPSTLGAPQDGGLGDLPNPYTEGRNLQHKLKKATCFFWVAAPIVNLFLLQNTTPNTRMSSSPEQSRITFYSNDRRWLAIEMWIYLIKGFPYKGKLSQTHELPVHSNRYQRFTVQVPKQLSLRAPIAFGASHVVPESPAFGYLAQPYSINGCKTNIQGLITAQVPKQLSLRL